MKTKFENIVLSCKMRFNRGEAVGWKHSDFMDLSRAILRDTKVSISTNTLKRIFGKIAVDEYYIPQQATIQALEKYGQNLYLADEAPLVNPVTEAPVKSKENPKKSIYRLAMPFALITLVGVCLIAFNFFSNKADFKSNLRFLEMEGQLPATAFFEYEAPQSKDSLFLNFGDKTPWVHITSGKHQLSHVYLFPGVFTATLQTRKKLFNYVNVYVPSTNWIGLGYRQGEELPRNYYEFIAAKTGKDSLFHISNQQLKNKGIDTAGLVYTRLCNFTPIAYTGEDFVFEAIFKNKVDDNGVYCKSTQFQVSGIKKRIRFRLATPGCSNRITNNVSEHSYVGSKINLSNFTMDLNRWTTVKMINHNKKVSLFVNDKLLYSGLYKEPIGNIKGLFLEFEGTAFVKSCKLSAEDGSILYQF
ncbi:hypothetical protein [Pedobacter agri]|uniref:hypothetical protein n=1 Tax=Pedobacter agri TaxID=454586 RepID=UPI00292CCD31|nr:hypothetical protein [Pedobacter agri]